MKKRHLHDKNGLLYLPWHSWCNLHHEYDKYHDQQCPCTKKEFGMLQAIGMSDHQLLKMLQLESLFYTSGTILIAATFGSALGYPLFLWAKKNAMYNISSFHYPAAALLLMIGILLLVQAVTTLALSKAVRKDSLIDRIRFYN